MKKIIMFSIMLMSLNSWATVPCENNGKVRYQCLDSDKEEFSICEYKDGISMASYTSITHKYDLQALSTLKDTKDELALGYQLDLNDPNTLLSTLTINVQTKMASFKNLLVKDSPELMIDCSIEIKE